MARTEAERRAYREGYLAGIERAAREVEDHWPEYERTTSDRELLIGKVRALARCEFLPDGPE